jgi:hypothetical protein
MSVTGILKGRLKFIALDVSKIIMELMQCHEYAEAGNFDGIKTRFQFEIKKTLEALERKVGERLDKCWEDYDRVLRWCKEMDAITTKYAIETFASNVCVEPYEKLK